jgi:hypothetical protein
MRLLARGLNQDPSGENAVGVRLFRTLDATLDLVKAGPLRRRLFRRAGRTRWPLAPGDYRIGDPAGAVAVCTLSSRDLIAPLAALPGAAIAGRFVTVNPGIELMVTNIAGTPAICVLVLCGAGLAARPCRRFRRRARQGRDSAATRSGRRAGSTADRTGR